ncbi:MAG: hypothetical protein AABO58_19810 [Acidobacteriota bacterium]
MNCDRELEVWRAVDARHWPERCDEELRAHVAACADCADVVDVASALSEEHVAAMRAAHVPASGAAWWRAQLRVRQDAARTARRAMNVIQAAVVFAALAIVAAIGGFAWVPGVLMNVQWNLPLIVALASPLALAPVAVYFAVTED